MPDISFSNVAPDEVIWGETVAPAGRLLAGYTRQGELCRLTFLNGKHKAASVLKAWRKEWPATRFTQSPKPLRKLKADGPVLLVGTDFQHRVWAALLDIPAGQTVTYGELAARIGKPKAARAVGTALGANPVPLLVPCHRVLASNGLGGYTGGLDVKKRLLAAEKA